MMDTAEWELGISVKREILWKEGDTVTAEWKLLVGRTVIAELSTDAEIDDAEAIRSLLAGLS